MCGVYNCKKQKIKEGAEQRAGGRGGRGRGSGVGEWVPPVVAMDMKSEEKQERKVEDRRRRQASGFLSGCSCSRRQTTHARAYIHRLDSR